MSEKQITASDFLTMLDEAVTNNGLDNKGRMILLRDMSDILDALNETPDSTTAVKITSGRDGYVVVNGPTYVRIYYEYTLQSEQWLWKGVNCRPNDKPSLIEYHYNGNKKTEQWRDYDKGIHRNGDKPAAVFYYENGGKAYEQWWSSGGIHRNGDKPANVGYHENGRISYEEWWKNNQRYRESDKPESVYYREDGVVIL